MQARNTFHKLSHSTPPLEKSHITDHTLLERLSHRVTDRFTHLSGLHVNTIPLQQLKQGKDPEPSAHPNCESYAHSRYCRQSWKAHLQELRSLPQVHWHRCKFGKYCAVVPLVWRNRCLAACQLVCNAQMSELEFEKKVELLEVLIENFAASMGVNEPPPPQASADDSSCMPPEEVSHPQVIAALEYIKRHLTESGLTVTRIAQDLGINASYLAHLFSQEMRIRMSRYIARRRIKLAQHLLIDTNWQIKRIAFESGHGNPFWFSEVFRTHTGMTPTEYRLAYSNGPNH